MSSIGGGFSVSTQEKDLGKFAIAIQALYSGRSNAVGTVTLATGATTTTVSAVNCSQQSKVFLFPTTADAVAALAGSGGAPSSSSSFSINKQTFTANGTYTPSANMVDCMIEAWGAGGGGGGCASAAANIGSGGGGGGAGGYSRLLASAATIGATQAVTIGTHGTGGVAGNNAGNPGGDTSVGTLCIGKGGSGGGGTASTGTPGGSGGAGGVSGTGDMTGVGMAGMQGKADWGSAGLGGMGGSTLLGAGAQTVPSTTHANGVAGAGFGAGGSGGQSFNAGGASSGGNGTDGFVSITEYIFNFSFSGGAAVAGAYVSSVAKQSFTITHANNATADRTFFYVCLG